MKLSAPRQLTFWIAVLLAVIGVIVKLVTVASLTPYAFWFVVAGFVILALGNLFEGI